MPSFLDIEPSGNIDITAPFQKESYNRFNTSELWGRAIKDESLIYQGYQWMMDDSAYRYNLDKDFDDKKKEKIFLNYADDIDPRFKNYMFEQARNELHFSDLIEEFTEETKKERALEDAGFSGTLMRIGAASLDLPLYIGGVAAAEVTAPIMALKAGSTFARRALVGGATETAIVAMQDKLGEREKETIDYVLGASFGAGINGLFRYSPLLMKSSQRAIERTLKPKELTEKLKGVADPEEQAKIIQKHYDDLGINKSEINSLSKTMDILKKEVQAKRFNPDIYNRMRIDFAYMTAKSDSDTFSNISAQTFIKPELQGNKAGFVSSLEKGTQVEDSLIESNRSFFHELINDFGKAKGKGFLSRRFNTAYERDFGKIAGKVQLNRNINDISDAEARDIATVLFQESGIPANESLKFANRLVKALSDDAEKSHKILSQYNKRGFGENGIEANPKYTTIHYNRNMAQDFEEKGISYAQFKDFIRGSLVSKNKNLEKDGTIDFLTDGLASGVWHNSEAYRTNNLDDVLDDLLRSEKYAEFRKQFENTTVKDRNVFTQSRSPFDYKYKMTVQTKKGEREISFLDLADDNFFDVRAMYARRMGGSVSLENIKVQRSIKQEANEAFFNVKRIVTPYLKELNKRIYVGKGAKTLGVSQEEVDKTIKEFSDFVEKEIDVAMKQFDNLGVSDTDKEYIKTEIKNYVTELRKVASDTYKRIEEAAAEGNELDFEKVFDDLYKENKQAFDNILGEVDKYTTLTDDLGSREARAYTRKQIDKELREKGLSDRKIKAELTRYDEMINEFEGNPTSENPFGILTQLFRIASNLNIARLLGQTGITMSAEYGGAMAHTGIRNFLEFSSFKSLINQMVTGKMDDKLAQDIQVHMGLGGGLLRSIRANTYDHQFNMTGKKLDSFLDKVEGFSEKAAEATLLFGGVKPLTSQLEITIAKDAISNISSMFGGTLTKRDLKDLNEMGLNMQMVKKIQSQIKKYGKKEAKKWSKGRKVVELNFDNWDDIEAKTALVTGVRRITNTIIQKSDMGNKIGTTVGNKLLRNSLIGKPLLDLKDYMITSYTKQLGRALGRKDSYTAGILMAQIGALSTATVMQNYMNFYGNEDKLKESLEPANLARNIFGKLPLSSYIPLATDTALSALTGEKLFSTSRYHSGVQDAVMGIPTMDLISKMMRITSIPFRSALTEKGFTGNDVNALFGVTPLGNWYLTRPLKELMVDNMKDKTTPIERMR